MGDSSVHVGTKVSVKENGLASNEKFITRFKIKKPSPINDVALKTNNGKGAALWKNTKVSLLKSIVLVLLMLI